MITKLLRLVAAALLATVIAVVVAHQTFTRHPAAQLRPQVQLTSPTINPLSDVFGQQQSIMINARERRLPPPKHHKHHKTPVVAATPTPTATYVPPPPVSMTANQRIAYNMLPSFGFDPKTQFSCLVNLWNRESGWNQYAQEPTSGAYGIPQALPASKMASAGADYMTNPATQIRWGLGYIKSVYITPCDAWYHDYTAGWY